MDLFKLYYKWHSTRAVSLKVRKFFFLIDNNTEKNMQIIDLFLKILRLMDNKSMNKIFVSFLTLFPYLMATKMPIDYNIKIYGNFRHYNILPDCFLFIINKFLIFKEYFCDRMSSWETRKQLLYYY